jgi:DNA-binding MarR family transcriptional regulator
VVSISGPIATAGLGPKDELGSSCNEPGGRPRRSSQDGRTSGTAWMWWASSLACERFVQSHPWKGRGGATDQAVMGALLQIAMKAGRMEIYASSREIAVRIASGSATASRSLGRLHRAGWIHRTGGGRGFRAATYRINRRASMEHSGLRDDPTPRPIPAETFCWAGLGWSRGLVYSLLDGEARSPQELAQALGIGVSTVRKHLQILEVHGLATRVMNGVIAGQADPTRMTGALGTAGRQDRQRETYRRSREQFRSRRSRPDVDPLTGEMEGRAPVEHSGPTPWCE